MNYSCFPLSDLMKIRAIQLKLLAGMIITNSIGLLILKKTPFVSQIKSNKLTGTFLAPEKHTKDSGTTETTEGRTWKLCCFG